MSSNTTVLVTGANRGIGRGLLAKYLSRPFHTVIACVRDPTNSTSKSLSELPKGESSYLIVVPYDNSSPPTIRRAIDVLKNEHKIKSINIVIPNAAVAETYGPLQSIPLEAITENFNTNTLGTVALFQETFPILSPAPDGTPLKWVTISSSLASIGLIGVDPINGLTPYCLSKVALNFFTRTIHDENPSFIAFPIHPGWVQTEMGNKTARDNGLEKAPTTIEECIDGIVGHIDSATREDKSGRFLSFDSEVELPW